MEKRYRLASVCDVRYGADFPAPRTAAEEEGIEASGAAPLGSFLLVRKEEAMTKVEAVVIRERVETVIDAVEAETGHVGVTVVEAIGHGRQRGITHEYRGRIFESRFLPKAVLTFVVDDDAADAVLAAIVDAARSGNESGDGIVWSIPVSNVTHNRTGQPLEEVEIG
jgi:nitrogen regulatory protein P-II 1